MDAGEGVSALPFSSCADSITFPPSLLPIRLPPELLADRAAAVVRWIGFLLQVLLQILHGTPSCAQLLSFVGFRYPLLSRTAASDPSPEVVFMPLHSEIPDDDGDGGEAVSHGYRRNSRGTVWAVELAEDDYVRLQGQRGLYLGATELLADLDAGGRGTKACCRVVQGVPSSPNDNAFPWLPLREGQIPNLQRCSS